MMYIYANILFLFSSLLTPVFYSALLRRAVRCPHHIFGPVHQTTYPCCPDLASSHPLLCSYPDCNKKKLDLSLKTSWKPTTQWCVAIVSYICNWTRGTWGCLPHLSNQHWEGENHGGFISQQVADWVSAGRLLQKNRLQSIVAWQSQSQAHHSHHIT